jgi:hypothetical protein
MMNFNQKPPEICIITRRAGYNYGSSLQAYAMQRIVEKLGFPNRIFNYDDGCLKLLWRLRPFIEDLAFRVMRFAPMFSKCLFRRKYQELCERDAQIKKFKNFEKTHLKLTPSTCRSSRKLAEEALDYDICICGSDQIWSPLLFDPAMFLDFCRETPVKTIAYAPSFGVSGIDSHREEIRELLKGIDIISVRENEGAEIIRELTGRDAPVVLDPTLLLDADDWRAIAQPPVRTKPYILCYFLGGSRIPHRFLAELQQETGCELLNVCTFRTRNDIPGDRECTMSPEEFLGAVANAAFVCTDSFHGTIFSILFERRFFTFERFGKERTGQNSRIYTLLERLGLSGRVMPFDQGYNRDVQPIEYREVRPVLQRNRKTSLEFLETALRCQTSKQNNQHVNDFR